MKQIMIAAALVLAASAPLLLGCKGESSEPEKSSSGEGSAAPSAAVREACANLTRLASKITDEEVKEALATEEACITSVAALHEDCTNSEAILACLAELDGADEAAIQQGLGACAVQCRQRDKAAAPAESAPARPADAPAEPALPADAPADARACANLGRLDTELGLGIEDLGDRTKCLEVMAGGVRERCTNADAIFECIATVQAANVDEFIDRFGACEKTLCEKAAPATP